MQYIFIAAIKMNLSTWPTYPFRQRRLILWQAGFLFDQAIIPGVGAPMKSNDQPHNIKKFVDVVFNEVLQETYAMGR
jgi:hypothetical protein